jgi:hypothetical protein
MKSCSVLSTLFDAEIKSYKTESFGMELLMHSGKKGVVLIFNAMKTSNLINIICLFVVYAVIHSVPLTL